jgi:predicted HTH transcriptional regulator
MLALIRRVLGGSPQAPMTDPSPSPNPRLRVKERPGHTIADRLLAAVEKNPGRTARELARLLGYDAQQSVHMDLLALLAAGRLRREGAGGPSDPHRYHLA